MWWDFSPRRLFAGFNLRQWGEAMQINHSLDGASLVMACPPLSRSTVQRNLDAKLKIGNIEALDLLIALICGAMMNLIFGSTALELPLVIGMPMLILAVCYFGKRGKPEKFLPHLLRFYVSTGFFAAGEEPTKATQMRRKIYA